MERTINSISSDFSTVSSVYHKPTSYIPVRVLGKGAFGEAVLYRKTEDNSLVVWKEVNLSRLDLQGRQAAQREVDILSLFSHPNVVAYYNHFLDGNLLLIEMEYCNGGSLYHKLGSLTSALSEVDTLWYLYQLASSLQHLHERQVLHRDIKALNIFLTKANVLKLGDFGIAKMLSDEQMAKSCVGTPYYMSPEMMRGGPYNHKSDMWAAGCVLYEMLTLKRTFDATNPLKLSRQIVHADFEPVPETYSLELRDLTNNLLDKDPTKRPSAEELLKNSVFPSTLPGQLAQLYQSLTRRPTSAGTDCSCIQPRVTSTSTEVFTWGAGRSHPGRLDHFEKEKAALHVAAGINHLAVITIEKELYAWAPNAISASTTGQLGHGDKSSHRTPKRVDNLSGLVVEKVCCGEEFTLVLLDDGRLLVTGSNYSGCLGNEEVTDCLTLFTPIPTFSGSGKFCVRRVACGVNHVICLTDTNDVYGWGSGELGRLGLDDGETDHGTPQKVPLKEHQGMVIYPSDLFAGSDSSFILTDTGKVLACGNNEHNKLGFNNAASGLGRSSKAICYDMPCFHRFTLVKPLIRTPIRFIAPGRTHSAVIDIYDKLHLFGSNRYGQLGRGDYKQHGGIFSTPKGLSDKRFLRVACGDGFTIAATSDNQLYSWGLGDNGRLGLDMTQEGSGSGPGKMCTPRPRAIFGALHSVSDVAASHWYTLIIAERSLQSRLVQSTSGPCSRETSYLLTGDELAFTNTEMDSAKSFTTNDDDTSKIPDWLADEMENASVIPIPACLKGKDECQDDDKDVDAGEDEIEEDEEKCSEEVANDIDVALSDQEACQCGCQEVIERLHLRIEQLEKANIMLRETLSSRSKKSTSK